MTAMYGKYTPERSNSAGAYKATLRNRETARWMKEADEEDRYSLPGGNEDLWDRHREALDAEESDVMSLNSLYTISDVKGVTVNGHSIAEEAEVLERSFYKN